MDYGPLVTEEIDAGARLVRAFDHYAPIKAAFWLKTCDEDQRYLCLASDRIDDTNFDLAYGAVNRLIDQIHSPYLNSFRVKVIYGTSPLTLAAVRVNTIYPNPFGTRLYRQSFGNLSADDVYIYPPQVLTELAESVPGR